MKQKILRRAAALLLALSLAVSLALPVWAAEGDDTPEYSISLSAEGNLKELTLEDGKTVTMMLTATVKQINDDNSEIIASGVNIAWTVSGDAVNISASGTTTGTNGTAENLVTAMKEGTAKITATVGGASAEYTVTVNAALGPSVSINKKNTTIEAGKTETLTATVTPTGADVEWSSSDDEVATVNANGVVTAVAGGTADITAALKDNPDVKDTCSVTVIEPSISIKDSTSIVAGTSETLTPTVSPSGASVTWSSSDDKVATVNQSGRVTAVTAGTAIITAALMNYPEIKDTCTVTVTAAPVPDLTGLTAVSGSTYNGHLFVKNAGPVELYVGPQPADAVLPEGIRWISTDTEEKIIKLTEGENGHVSVRQVGPGEAYIYASTADGTIKSAQYKITVSGIIITTDPGTLQLGKTMSMTCERFGAAATAGVPTWTSDRPTIINASSGRITARAVGTAKITASIGIYSSVPVEIKVVENTDNIITGSITNAQTYLFSSIVGQLNNVCYKMTESGSLDYLINLSVSPSQGTLYYNYVSSADHNHGVGNVETYYLNPGISQWGLRDITFVPAPGFTGTAKITYLGYNTQGDSYSGEIRLEISSSGDVTYSTPVNTPIAFEAADFNAVCREKTGRDLSYVTFTLPDPLRGTLYYNYIASGQYASLISSTDRCYRNRAPYLEGISFVPAAGYTGTLRISYRCVDTSDASFSGYVTINVTSRGSQEVEGDVVYRALQGERVTFVAADFNDACLAALGETLDYLYFTLPDRADGTLYYNRTTTSGQIAISANTRCYRSTSTSTTSLSRVSFLPSGRDLDVVTIPFTAYGTGGSRFNGTVVLRYTGGDGEIAYSTRAGQAKLFEAADFNELCVDLTGENLSYIRFNNLPLAAQGTLYYNYSSSFSTGSKVTTSTRLYRSSGYSATLSRVAFVPNASYSGPVSLDFTGYGTDGDRLFTGTVLIEVDSAGDLTVRYTAFSGRPLTFAASDFNLACQTATGSTLNYVQFQLPSSTAGSLYYNYDSSKTSNTSVSASTSYYRTGSGRLLSSVTFLPSATYTGTLNLTYTGVASSGDRYTGTVQITVSSPAAQPIRYSTSSLPLTFTSYSFYQASNAVLPKGLSYIQFTSLPTSSQGTLYYGYTTPGTGSRASIGTRYYYSGSPDIGQLRFVPAAGFQGQVTLYYSAYDSAGERVTGTVVITVTSQTASSSFRDMTSYSWAVPAVEFLSQGGVVSGMGGGQFGPGQSVKRGDFVLMLCKALQFNTGGTSSFWDVPSNSYYAWAIATVQNMGLAAGSNGRFNPENALTRQDAMVIIQKALQAAGKSVPSASYATLSAYTDNNQIADYARNAMASMVQLGVISGYGNGQLRPQSPITRAEVAVILHKILTQ